MTILDDLRELMGEDMPLEDGLRTLAEGLATFYNTLIGQGVPDADALEMTAALIAAVCSR